MKSLAVVILWILIMPMTALSGISILIDGGFRNYSFIQTLNTFIELFLFILPFSGMAYAIYPIVQKAISKWMYNFISGSISGFIAVLPFPFIYIFGIRGVDLVKNDSKQLWIFVIPLTGLLCGLIESVFIKINQDLGTQQVDAGKADPISDN